MRGGTVSHSLTAVRGGKAAVYSEPRLASSPFALCAWLFAFARLRLDQLILLMSSTTNGKALYENLDTAFVNIWSLLRNLTQKGFIGRVHVELTNYSADVFLNGSSTPLVHEVDHAAGTNTLEEAALHRLVLRARETPGTISVFEGANEAIADQVPAPSSFDDAPPVVSGSTESTSFEAEPGEFPHEASIAPPIEPIEISPQPEVGWRDETPLESKPVADGQGSLTINLGGELIGAVERGINASGEDFSSLFDAVRLELADDYGYLDPMSNALTYSNGAVSLTHDVSEAVYVSGLSEALRRTVDRVAVGDRARRVRERIALELLSVARQRKEALEHSKFSLQLDRIAGTKVI